MAKIGQIREVAIADIIPYEQNAKQHPADQLERLQNSIKEFGFLSPCLIDEHNNLIAGHGRVEACRQMGWEKVPCISVKGLTETQKKAYILADNRLTELGEWDWNIVNNELEDLSSEGFNIDLTGFKLENLDGYNEDFELPAGDKSQLCQMTFTLHEEQKNLIEYALSVVGDDIVETFGNTNKNGNAIYEVVRQWAEQRK